MKRAILHVDADAFFAACEQAVRPDLKGKPVIVGKERGIATALSYEAKAMGLSRGMTISQIKKQCPNAIILPGDYETYSLFSRRLFSILRRCSGTVEEYGIDEGFVDITGMRGPLKMSYEEIGCDIKRAVQRELGITVSVGLAPTKALAKIASKWKKPDGFVAVYKKDINVFLHKVPVEQIWGVGRNSAAYMRKLGIETALSFVQKPLSFIEEHFAKPHIALWHELRGDAIYPVITEEKTSYASIAKTRTFTPASSNTSFVYAELLKNLENACIKARRHHLVTRKVVILLKEQNFEIHALEACLTRASAYPQDIIPIVRSLFETLFSNKKQYRSSGVVLADLEEDRQIQQTLFEAPVQLTRLKQIYSAVDTLAARFGKHTVHSAGMLRAARKSPRQSLSLPSLPFLRLSGILASK